MLFGLTNTPNTFMSLLDYILLDYILRAFIGRLFVVYLNDILVCNKSLDEHMHHLKCVLDVLRKEQLYTNKWSFCKDCDVFLG